MKEARDAVVDVYGRCTSEDLQRGQLPPGCDYGKIRMVGSNGIRQPSDLENCEHIVGKGSTLCFAFPKLEMSRVPFKW
jgi:hypothetical protein